MWHGERVHAAGAPAVRDFSVRVVRQAVARRFAVDCARPVFLSATAELPAFARP